MAEYITKQAVREALLKRRWTPIDWHDIKSLISSIPPADVRPVRRGRWEPRDLTFGRSIYECSNCKLGMFVPTVSGNPVYPYCPNCCADMSGGDDDGDEKD